MYIQLLILSLCMCLAYHNPCSKLFCQVHTAGNRVVAEIDGAAIAFGCTVVMVLKAILDLAPVEQIIEALQRLGRGPCAIYILW